MLDVLDADSGELEALYHVFFDAGRFRDEFVQGAGSDLLYVSEVRLEPRWKGRNIDVMMSGMRTMRDKCVEFAQEHDGPSRRQICYRGLFRSESLGRRPRRTKTPGRISLKNGKMAA